MKKTLHISILIMLIGFFFSSCKDDDDKNERIYQVKVASVKPFFHLSEVLEYNTSSSIQKSQYVPTYFVKYLNNNKWDYGRDIEGFTYEEGFEYTLEVKSIDIDPSLGISRIVLIKEISKVQKDSENIPLQKKKIIVASRKAEDTLYPYYILNNDKWVKFPTIEGFDSIYEEGFEYELEINCKYNGANATPKYSFIYAETVQKEKKNSEGL